MEWNINKFFNDGKCGKTGKIVLVVAHHEGWMRCKPLSDVFPKPDSDSEIASANFTIRDLIN